jgi:hypothetical protein
MEYLSPLKEAQALALLTCTLEVPGPHVGTPTVLSEIFLGFTQSL